MAEFCFLFYPGDYLRDTQNFSEATQVAYDRIMCEHMRNICVSELQLKFFTKRLTPDEKEELATVLVKIKEGYYIEWVAREVRKRMSYVASRSKNRTSNNEMISNSYDKHMEIEIEKELENKEEKGSAKKGGAKIIYPTQDEVTTELMQKMNNPKGHKFWPEDKCRIEASKFWLFYDTNGWVQGKSTKKIKKWKSALALWINNAGNFDQPPMFIEKPAPQPPKPVEPPAPRLPIIAEEINCLYELFLEDNSKITIISCDTRQCDYLKSSGVMKFTLDERVRIGDMADEKLKATPTTDQEAAKNRYQKLFAIIEFFKQQQEKGTKMIFKL